MLLFMRPCIQSASCSYGPHISPANHCLTTNRHSTDIQLTVNRLSTDHLICSWALPRVPFGEQNLTILTYLTKVKKILILISCSEGHLWKVSGEFSCCARTSRRSSGWRSHWASSAEECAWKDNRGNRWWLKIKSFKAFTALPKLAGVFNAVFNKFLLKQSF